MTDAELKAYYADLLILQYIGQPKAYATIEALAGMAIINQLPMSMNDAFDPATAVGSQLDTVGKYAGVTRDGYGLGGEPISLDDDDFRQLLSMAIALNNGGSSLYDIQVLLNQHFPDQILVFDQLDMRMSYFLDESIGSYNLAQMFVTQGLLPKPMGVKLSSVIYSPDIFQFFGFRTYDLPGYNVSPLNDYLDYQMDWPFLSYQDAL